MKGTDFRCMHWWVLPNMDTMFLLLIWLHLGTSLPWAKKGVEIYFVCWSDVSVISLKAFVSLFRWYTPVILAFRETEARVSKIWAHSGQLRNLASPSVKIKVGWGCSSVQEPGFNPSAEAFVSNGERRLGTRSGFTVCSFPLKCYCFQFLPVGGTYTHTYIINPF